MAKCFDVTGYIEPCNVLRDKYSGRALLIIGFYNGLTLSGRATTQKNGLVFKDSLNTAKFDGEDGFVSKWKAGANGNVLPVSIDAQNPFGVTIQGNTDSGRVMYIKTIPVSIPATRDGKAEEFVMGLQKGIYGTSTLVLESSENKNINDVFGIYSPLRLDPTSVTRNEYENGGAWSFNLVCEEPVANVICQMTGLGAAIDELNV